MFRWELRRVRRAGRGWDEAVLAHGACATVNEARQAVVREDRKLQHPIGWTPEMHYRIVGDDGFEEETGSVSWLPLL